MTLGPVAFLLLGILSLMPSSSLSTFSIIPKKNNIFLSFSSFPSFSFLPFYPPGKNSQSTTAHHSTTNDNSSSAPLKPQRDVSNLVDWAKSKHVHFHNCLSIVKYHDMEGDNEGHGMVMTRPAMSDTVILHVPDSLILSSSRILQGDVSKTSTKEEALEVLRSDGVSRYQSEFLLFYKVVQEYILSSESYWFGWIQSLPRTFNHGCCMNEKERSLLPPLALVILDQEDRKLSSFRKALRILMKFDDNNSSDTATTKGGDDKLDFDELTRWAYCVVSTRSWRRELGISSSSTGDSSTVEASIVPLGDMFDHNDQEYSNVIIQDCDNDDDDGGIDVVLKKDITIDTTTAVPLYLSYGMPDTHRFLIIFGFIDMNMMELPSQIYFDNPSDELVRLGCTDRNKMTFRVEDGAISNAVWDCVLYGIVLKQLGREEEQVAFMRAFLGDDDGRYRSDIHSKYALECCLVLRRHVVDTMKGYLCSLKDVSDKNYPDGTGGDEDCYSPRLSLIIKHNTFVRNALQRVKNRLDGMIQMELIRRRQAPDG